MRASMIGPEKIDPPDVQPLLARPAVDAAAEHRRGKLRRVGPPVFIGARGHVADDLAPLGVQARDDARRDASNRSMSYIGTSTV